MPASCCSPTPRVDPITGQVTLRGEFPNPKRELLPGMYVRVQIEQGIDPDAIAVPQQAVQRNGGGAAKSSSSATTIAPSCSRSGSAASARTTNG